MEKIKSFFYPMTKDKAFRLGAVLLAAVGTIFATVFFILNCFNTSKSKFYNGYFLFILLIMIATTIYLLRFLLLDKKWSYPRVFVVLALGWSISMQLVMPPISGVDEVSHYYGAYHCSNILLGMKDHDFETERQEEWGRWIQGTTYFEMRAEDYILLPTVDITFPYQYQVLADGNWFHCPEEAKQLVPCYEYPARARRYLVSGAGMAIARLLGFGFAGTIFMGRMMNSLLLIFMGWFCLKIIPVGKLQIVSFALFPTILQLCSSYSYDNMSILFSLLLLTMCLYYSQDHVKLHAWDIIIIAICMAMLIPNKTVYALFGVWFFMIPIKKWWKDVGLSKKWYEYGILAVVLAGIIVVGKKLVTKYYWAVYSQIFWKWDGSIEQDDTMTSYTWYYFKDHIPETLKFAWNGIKVDFWYNIKHVIGAEIGHVRLNATVPVACTVLLLICLIVGIVINKGKRIKPWQYVILGLGLLLCLVAVFIGCLVRFTPVEGSERIQISYRYLIPIYMCLSVALGTDAKENKKALALIYIQNIVLIFAMCGTLYFLLHLRDGQPVPEILKLVGIS